MCGADIKYDCVGSEQILKRTANKYINGKAKNKEALNEGREPKRHSTGNIPDALLLLSQSFCAKCNFQIYFFPNVLVCSSVADGACRFLLQAGIMMQYSLQKG